MHSEVVQEALYFGGFRGIDGEEIMTICIDGRYEKTGSRYCIQAYAS